MKKILSILCFIALCTSAKAESVFSLDLKTDIAISTLAIGVFAGSFFIETPPGNIPDSLNRNDVNALDRSLMFTRLNSPVRYTSTAAMVTMAGLLPLVPVMGNFNMDTIVTYGVMYTQATLLAYGTRVLLRNNITRWRPYLYDGRELNSGHRHDAFPSGHTCVAFMSATFFTTTFSLDYPDSRWKWPLIAGSYTIASCIGALRIISGMHFFTDVLAGAAIGSLYGWLIPYLHRNRNSENDFPIIFTGNGLLLSLKL